MELYTINCKTCNSVLAFSFSPSNKEDCLCADCMQAILDVAQFLELPHFPHAKCRKIMMNSGNNADPLHYKFLKSFHSIQEEFQDDKPGNKRTETDSICVGTDDFFTGLFSPKND